MSALYLENKLGKVYCEIHGPEDAPAVVLSHGVNMNHEAFESQVKA